MHNIILRLDRGCKSSVEVYTGTQAYTRTNIRIYTYKYFVVDILIDTATLI